MLLADLAAVWGDRAALHMREHDERSTGLAGPVGIGKCTAKETVQAHWDRLVLEWKRWRLWVSDIRPSRERFVPPRGRAAVAEHLDDNVAFVLIFDDTPYLIITFY